MEWWQIVLIVLASIAGGILVAVLLIILIELLSGKRYLLTYLDKRSVKMRKVASGGKEQLLFLDSDLVAEVINNHRIATEPDTNEMITFQTQVWDAHQYEVDRLPVDFRQDLKEAYMDMRLANSIVWLSTEFSRRSPTLDENYRKLRSSIAEKLDRIKPLIERLAKQQPEIY